MPHFKQRKKCSLVKWSWLSCDRILCMTFLFVTNCYYNSSGGAEINGENAICLYSPSITHNQGNVRTVFDILCVKLQLQCYIVILFKINKMLYLNLFIKILCFPSLNYNLFFWFCRFHVYWFLIWWSRWHNRTSVSRICHTPWTLSQFLLLHAGSWHWNSPGELIFCVKLWRGEKRGGHLVKRLFPSKKESR